MEARTPKVHYLRHNQGERTPHKLLVFDTETEAESEGPRELLRLRTWAARVVRRHHREPRRPATETHAGTTTAELLELIEATGAGRDTLWIFAHNLNFDLGVTRLPLALLDAGYELGKHNLASEAPWAHLKRGKRGLRLADSWSWLPTSVEKLGEMLGVPKPPLPASGAPEAAWRERCLADVDITASALCRLMDEWDERALGWWSLTGPASGWNSMLHMHLRGSGGARTHVARTAPGASSSGRRARVVIDPDPSARAFEREALYSGRRDLWRVGRLPGGPYAELDLKTAHLAVCASLPLPYRRWAQFDHLELDDWRLDNRYAGLVARVVVRTPAPRYPLRLPGGIVHPVGTFETVLATPEIADARASGRLVSIGAGYGYHLGRQMQEWSEWALGVLNSGPEAVDPVFQAMVKGWSRSVPGRWGMTISREIARGPSHVADWGLEAAAIGRPPRRGYILHLAGAWSECVRDQEAEDAFPAVLAHIQSWTRLLLGRLIEGVPEGCLVSCNTEGLWVHQAALAGLAELALEHWTLQVMPRDAAARALYMLNKRTAPLQVRVKQTARRLRVLSPQHLQTERERQFSGVPRSALQTGPDKYEFWTWPKLKGQIERGDPRGYVREKRIVDLNGLPVSRWTFQDGCCEPVEAAWSAAGGNVILAPPERCPCHGSPLRPLQHPALRMPQAR